MRKHFAFIAAVAGVAISHASPALAISYEPLPSGNGIRIKGTGYNVTGALPPNTQTPVATGVDPNWTIKAFASNAVTSPNLYIPNGIPSQWYSSSGANTANNPITFASDPLNTYRWATYAAYANEFGVAPSNATPANRSQSFFGRAGSPAGPTTGNYSYIVSTTFQLNKSARYIFDYNTTADNRVQLYLNGCVVNSGTQTPGITTTVSPLCPQGGILIAENAADTAGQFGTLLSGSTSLDLAAGTYELNYVVTDNWNGTTYGQTGILIGASAFTEAVPAPLPILGATSFFAYSRKLRRRIHKVAS